jgi:hypothetical protein
MDNSNVLIDQVKWNGLRRICESGLVIFRGLGSSQEKTANTFEIEHEIELVPGALVVKGRSYHYSVEEREFIKQECLRLLQAKVIKESTSLRLVCGISREKDRGPANVYRLR